MKLSAAAVWGTRAMRRLDNSGAFLKDREPVQSIPDVRASATMKWLSRTLLCAYLLVLLWLTLFKLSFDIYAVLTYHQTRSLNLVPFADYSRGGLREMVDNVVVFVPFGVLLGVELKQVGLGRKLALVCMFSLAVEIAQFVFAIGVTDISDVIANTSGGLAGLILYSLAKKIFNNKIMDNVVVVGGMLLLVSLLLYRILFLKVRY